MELNKAINEAIKMTIDDGLKSDKLLVKNDFEKTERLYRLFGTWFAINFKNNLSKILKENKKVEDK